MVGSLGAWVWKVCELEVWKLGGWECGSLGVEFGVWECGSVGVWECGSLGAWELGSLGAEGLGVRSVGFGGLSEVCNFYGSLKSRTGTRAVRDFNIRKK